MLPDGHTKNSRALPSAGDPALLVVRPTRTSVANSCAYRPSAPILESPRRTSVSSKSRQAWISPNARAAALQTFVGTAVEWFGARGATGALGIRLAPPGGARLVGFSALLPPRQNNSAVVRARLGTRPLSSAESCRRASDPPYNRPYACSLWTALSGRATSGQLPVLPMPDGRPHLAERCAGGRHYRLMLLQTRHEAGKCDLSGQAIYAPRLVLELLLNHWANSMSQGPSGTRLCDARSDGKQRTDRQRGNATSNFVPRSRPREQAEQKHSFLVAINASQQSKQAFLASTVAALAIRARRRTEGLCHPNWSTCTLRRGM